MFTCFASHSRENAQIIFASLLEFYRNFPLDVQDGQGIQVFFETKRFSIIINFILALLLAYKNGHGQLCRALVTAGANLSICNHDSLSIFTMPAASKALLVIFLVSKLI